MDYHKYELSLKEKKEKNILQIKKKKGLFLNK